MTRPTLEWLKTNARLARFYELRANENAYVVFHTRDVAVDGSANIHLKNPTDADPTHDIDVVSIIPSTQFAGTYSIHDTFSVAPNAGDPLTSDNMVMDSDGNVDAGVVEAHADVDFTADNQHLELPFPSGIGLGESTQGGRGLGTEPIIEPGREIVVEITNESNAEATGGIAVIYTENGDHFE